MNLATGEKVLNMGGDGSGETFEVVERAVDPTQLPTPYSSPADFAGQYPTPLDTVEIIAMCEELSVWQALPELPTALKQDMWRELNELAFTSGSTYISFADGMCPEEYSHDGTNTTVTLKNLGAKKNLSQSDLIHSRAIAGANWHGINTLTSPLPASQGVPGGTDIGSMAEQEFVADLKEKEVVLASTLVLNGWDRLLVNGDVDTNSLEFDGIVETLHTGSGVHQNAFVSGTFTANGFDAFLSESCAKPTTVFGHPQAVQEMMGAYYEKGYQGSQLINFNSGDRITPGFNFSGFVNTGIGKLAVVADNNFPKTDMGGGSFASKLYALRMNHNGTPLVYKRTQIPFQLNDLVPGCTSISFQVWAKTALIIKHLCAHGAYRAVFSGRDVTTCPVIG